MIKKQIQIGKNDLILATGKMARQADGAVTVQCGDTIVLVTAVSPDKPREGADFFPLFVDYREKKSAAGRFPGGYIKREARPTEKEVLTCRLTDRPLRPLFPEGFFYEVQVMADVLSADGQNDPDILAVNGASAALSISNIPFSGPIGAVRVGMIDNEFIINPTHDDLEKSAFNLVVAGPKEGISMIEGQSQGISEEIVLNAIKFAEEYIHKIIDLQLELQKDAGKPKKEVTLLTPNAELMDAMQPLVNSELNQIIQIKEKEKRQGSLKTLLNKTIAGLQEQFPEEPESSFALVFRKIEKEIIRDLMLNQGKRCDGRSFDEVRPISSEVNFLPRTHGSALFTRGETQCLAITTLGTASDEQRVEDLTGESSKTFMLHYSFPPFSVGEVRPVRGPGRREIGHGALAEKALRAVLPEATVFPYTIRIVSDILESNGSSSMASVCGGCLSLMDAGVPIKDIISGIAMGLATDGKKNIVLTDIMGTEDACGGMDFKVAGTSTSITAIQLDVKIKQGLTLDLIKEILERALKARLHILDEMKATIDKPRASLSEYAPRIKTIQIEPDKIGTIIGTGGRVIKRIIEETGANIEIEDDGRVLISASNEESINKAVTIVEGLTHEVEVGNIYDGKVRTITDFGAFVEIMPGRDGLVHVSELSEKYIKNVTDAAQVGDTFKVIVLKVDDKGRISLSRKRAPK